MQSSTESIKSVDWFIECGAHLPNGKFMRNQMMKPDEVNVFRFKHNNLGVYTTAYLYDNLDLAESNLSGDFYLDFDYDLTGDEQEAAFNVVRQDVVSSCRYLKVILGIEKEEIQLFFSGSKGIHLMISKEALGVLPSKYLNRYYRMLAEDISKYTSGKTLDLKIYDNRRLFRMPNSIHQKTNLYKVYLLYEELDKMSLSDIKEIAKATRIIPATPKKVSSKAKMEFSGYEKKFDLLINKTKANFSESTTLDYMPPCVSYLLDNAIGSGQRNDTVAFLANFFKQSGLTEEETITKLHDWNGRNCTPSLPDKEIELTVNSIYSGSARMGCSTAKIISTCDLTACKLGKKRRNF